MGYVNKGPHKYSSMCALVCLHGSMRSGSSKLSSPLHPNKMDELKCKYMLVV